VHVLHPETVSQREKINETGVTGTGPSPCTHTHLTHRHVSFFPTYIHGIMHTHTHTHTHRHTHTAQPLSPLIHSPCTLPRILMCSLRALLSVCVTCHPSARHSRPGHRGGKSGKNNPPLTRLSHTWDVFFGVFFPLHTLIS